MHSLLDHLRDTGFDWAPRALGRDELGREILSYLPGETVGSRLPWPAWVYSDDALTQVATWVRCFHAAVAGFEPQADAVWREGGHWEPGLIIGHNDAAPYNAAWANGKLVGFFDWDLAAPVTPEWDLAFTAFAWVPATLFVGKVSRHSPTGLGDYGYSSIPTAGKSRQPSSSPPSRPGSRHPPKASVELRPLATPPTNA